MPLTATVAVTDEELLRLAPAWEALADAVDGPLFSRPFWCLPWAHHLTRGRPHVIALHDGDELVAVAPLSRRTVGGIELMRFLGHGLGTVSSLLHHPAHPAAEAELWAAVLAGRRRFAQLIEHRATAPGSPVAARWPQLVLPRDACPTIACTTDFDTYLAERPKKLRENLRRAGRAVVNAGQDHAIEVVTTPDRWREVRPEVLQVFDAAEAAQPRQHMFRGALGPNTDAVLVSSAEAGKLRLFVGRIDGQPASFGIAFASGGTLSYWITRFDPRFASASVGLLLLRTIIQHGFDEGFDEVDLLLGDQSHKRRWSTSSYETLTVLAASSPSLLRAGVGTLALAERVRRG